MRLFLVLGLLAACTPKELEYDDADLDGVPASLDCDDADPAVFPVALEVCNGVDDDCDGTTDEEAVDAPSWYADVDGDGYGDDATAIRACEAPADTVALGGDCDDSDTAFYPGAVEDDCTDPNDYNCDGSVAWADEDGDGWAACEDCDDNDEDVHPEADEVCNGEDDDCDGETDEDPVDGDTWYEDLDDDGYGGTDSSKPACEDPGDGWYPTGDDCDDADDAQHPGADELCSTDEDDDCDGTVNEDDAADATTWYADSDSDTFGDPDTTTTACSQPSGYVADDQDCDDTDGDVNPGETDTCDGTDNDCSGDEDGLVTLTPTSGSTTDLSSAWGGGTNSSPHTATYYSSADIAVCPGTYWVQIVANGASVDVTGPYGSSTTILDGGGSGSVLRFNGTSATVAVEGLTIQDGDTQGGGIDANDSGIDLTLTDVVVEDCDGTYGAGIYLAGGTLVATDLVLDGNDASLFGGGLYVDAGTATLYDCDLTDNSAQYSGGAIYTDGSADLTMDGCTASGNIASGSTGYGGGVLATESGDADIIDCTLYDNEATSNAGGVAYLGRDPGAGSITIEDSILYGNYAYDEGGAIVIQSGDLTLSDTLLYDNEGTWGGAIFIFGADVLCESSASASNHGLISNTGTYGGAAYLEDRYYNDDAVLESDTCDWGTTSGGDNSTTPELDGYGGLSRSYGDNASFTCYDDNTCY